jgi:hypothetical protein
MDTGLTTGNNVAIHETGNETILRNADRIGYDALIWEDG